MVFEQPYKLSIWHEFLPQMTCGKLYLDSPTNLHSKYLSVKELYSFSNLGDTLLPYFLAAIIYRAGQKVGIE